MGSRRRVGPGTVAMRQCLQQTAQGHKEDEEAPHPCGGVLIAPPRPPPHHRSVDPQHCRAHKWLGTVIESAKINSVDRV